MAYRNSREALTNMAHWTSSSLEDLMFSVVFDFAESIWQAAEKAGVGVADPDSHTFQVDYAELGARVGETARRVEYFFKCEAKDLSVKRANTWAKALGHRLALVLYDQPGETQDTGPVMSCVFTACWIMCGRPRTMWDLEDAAKKLGVELPDEFKPHYTGE